MKKALRKCLILLMACCLLFGMSTAAMATETTTDSSTTESTTETASDPTTGVMFLEYVYVKDNGHYVALTSGSCFLINDEYVLTNYHIFDLDQEYSDGLTLRQYIVQKMGLDSIDDNDEHLQIFVFPSFDTHVVATMDANAYSVDLDFVALKLEKSGLGNHYALALGDSDTLTSGDSVRAYGYPTTSVSAKDYNSSDDVSVTSGYVTKMTDDMIEHDAALNYGSSGGPLLDANGNVIGINSYSISTSTGSTYYANNINDIKKILTTYNIAFTDSSADSTDIAEEEPAGSADSTLEVGDEETGPSEALLATLSATIEDAEDALEEDKDYTEESTKALQDAIEDANDVLDNDAATDEDVNAAIEAVEDAVDDLEEEESLFGDMMIPIIIIIIVVVVVIILVVVLLMRKKNTKQAAADDIAGTYSSDPIPVTPNNIPVQDNGAGETTLLDSGAGETTLLSGAGQGAYLIRRKNGEKITISTQNFAIGKERAKVQYCIADNKAVSRCHAIILKKGADYYISDQRSSNFTYVNGVQLSPYQETLLTDKTVVRLADEEFEFHLG